MTRTGEAEPCLTSGGVAVAIESKATFMQADTEILNGHDDAIRGIVVENDFARVIRRPSRGVYFVTFTLVRFKALCIPSPQTHGYY